MEYVKLGEVATFINGYAFKPSDWKKEGIPIIRIQNLTGNNREINYYQGKIDEKYHVKKGEILISWSASIDVYEWKGKNGYLNQHIFKVVFDKMDIDKDFFVYLIKNKLNEIKKYTHGSTMKHITKSKFDNIKIRIPSKEEQIKIANKLNKIIIIIEKQKEQLELLENLKKSQFFELFGDPIKNEKGWEIKKLGNLLKVQGGYAFKSKDFVKRGIKLIQIGNVYLDDIDWENINHVPDNYLEKYKEFKLKEKDIVIAMTRPIIKSLESVKISIVKKKDLPCLLNQRVGRFILSGNINKVYLIEILKQKIFKNYVEKMSGNSLQPNISNKDIENFTIIYPKIELQNKFATRIEAIQKLKFEIEKSLKETENLYNSLMQKFFSNK